MPAYKDQKTGTWYVKFYSRDWTGVNRQIKKRGFATKREALDFERSYKIRQECNLDMTFGNFFELYKEDMEPRLKRNTWLSKEHIIRTKILPYFKDKKMNEITAADVLKWQNEMMAGKDAQGVVRHIKRCLKQHINRNPFVSVTDTTIRLFSADPSRSSLPKHHHAKYMVAHT